jgi:hypothetical protein
MLAAAAGKHRKDEGSSSGIGSKLLHALAGIPGTSILIDSVRSWWSQNPMRVAGLVAADAAKTMLRPMAQRNPVVLVLGAVVVGALLIKVRPWRGILRPALFAGLLPQLISRLMAQVPVESWIDMLTSFTKKPSHPAPPAAAPAAAQAAPQREKQPTAGQSTTTLH